MLEKIASQFALDRDRELGPQWLTKDLVMLLRKGVAEWNAWHEDARKRVRQHSDFKDTSFRLALAIADLSGADLRKLNLKGADLKGAVLFRASLTEADLAGADLTGANLGEANLAAVNLSKGRLSKASLLV